MRPVRTVLSVVVLACAPVLLPGCGASEKIEETQPLSVSIVLQNNSTATVHMFVGTETFPCCQLTPAGTRTAVVSLTPGESTTAKVGQNGQVLAQTSCTYSSNAAKNAVSVVHVRWNGTALTCGGDWD